MTKRELGPLALAVAVAGILAVLPLESAAQSDGDAPAKSAGAVIVSKSVASENGSFGMLPILIE